MDFSPRFRALRPIVFLSLLHLCCHASAQVDSPQELESRLQDVGPGPQRVELLVSLAEIHRELGDCGRALERGTAALALLGEHTDARLELRLHLVLSSLRSSAGEIETALEHARSARSLAQELADADAEGEADYRVALALWYGCEHDAAIEAAERARRSQLEREKLEPLGRTLTLLGAIHRSRSAHDEALACHLEALEIALGRDDERSIARSRNNIGLIYWSLDRHDEALEWLEPVLNTYRSMGSRRELAAALSNVGLIQIALGRPQRALPLLEEALETNRELGQRRATGRVLANLAYAFEKLGDPVKAKSFHLQAREVREDVGDKWGLSRTLGSLANLSLELDEPAEAVQFAELALVAAEEAGALEEQAEIHGKLAQAYEAVGDASAALASYRRQREIEAKFHSDAVERRIATLELGHKVDEKERELERSERVRLEQEVVLEQGRTRQVVLLLCVLVLAGVMCAFYFVGRARARALADARRAEEDRIRIEKLESLGVLAGGIAHEFNNALASVLGQVWLAQSKVGSKSDVGSMLLAAESAVDHAKGLTAQLLAFAKGGEPQRKHIDVGGPLREAVEFGLAGSGIQATVEVDPGLWTANLDASQLKQAVVNLVRNAREAMPDGGHVEVRADNFTASESLSPTAGRGPYVRIRVRDHGPGVPEDVQARMFDPYFTTKDGGSGLGLSNTFAIVTRHGGWLGFESASARGTTFSLYFPASPEQEPDGDSVARPESAGLPSDVRVLVVDDDERIRVVYRMALEDLGWHVHEVATGAAAVEAYSRRAGDAGFDLVIMDLTMPGDMGGRTAMEEILRKDPDAVGIVSSGYCSDPVMSDFQAAGFRGALAKPFRMHELHGVLGEVLRSRSG